MSGNTLKASPTPFGQRDEADVPGIVIVDGRSDRRAAPERPRLRAFVYGEALPPAPTLPFGRWKEAS